jgi:hypothetical protein
VPGNVKPNTWTMIKKLFKKTSTIPIPSTESDIIKQYTSMINHFVDKSNKLYIGQRVGKTETSNRVYAFYGTLIKDSFNLDFVKMSPMNLKKNYDESIITHIGMQFPEYHGEDDFEVMPEFK